MRPPRHERRGFLKTSAGLAAALVSGAPPARGELPVPEVAGRSYRDARGRRAELYALLGDLPDRERTLSPRPNAVSRSATATCSSPGCST